MSFKSLYGVRPPKKLGAQLLGGGLTPYKILPSELTEHINLPNIVRENTGLN